MDTGTAGGYLTTTEMDTMIIKTITEMSAVRQVARVKSTSKKTIEIPKRTGIPVATYEGEAAQGPVDQSVYGNEQLTAYRLTVTVPFTMDLLNDSSFSLENEINADVAEAFAFGEGNKFVLGTGSKQPEGFLVNADIISDTATSETSATITGDDLLLLTGELKVGYNAMYAFNRKTLAFLRTLKGSDGHYLWQASLAPNVPNTIAGEPYIQFQDMPDIAASSKSIIYGDFLRGYTITDRTGMVIIRDDVTQKRNAIIELTFHKWNTGQVVLSEAFKLLTTKS
jgi:HK97 family phage major capsid protein